MRISDEFLETWLDFCIFHDRPYPPLIRRCAATRRRSGSTSSVCGSGRGWSPCQQSACPRANRSWNRVCHCGTDGTLNLLRGIKVQGSRLDNTAETIYMYQKEQSLMQSRKYFKKKTKTIFQNATRPCCWRRCTTTSRSIDGWCSRGTRTCTESVSGNQKS